MLCSKFYCIRVFKLKLFSYKIGCSLDLRPKLSMTRSSPSASVEREYLTNCVTYQNVHYKTVTYQNVRYKTVTCHHVLVTS